MLHLLRFPTREAAEAALASHDSQLLGTRTLELTRHNRCLQWTPQEVRASAEPKSTYFVFLKNIARGYEQQVTQFARRLPGCKRVHVTHPSTNESIAFANLSFVNYETANAAITELDQVEFGGRKIEALPNMKQGAFKDRPEVAQSLTVCWRCLALPFLRLLLLLFKLLFKLFKLLFKLFKLLLLFKLLF